MIHFLKGIKHIFEGNTRYYITIALLFGILGVSGWVYANQYTKGLILTAMRDQVSWGFYIANFTFLVGVAAAAVILVIPAYLYSFKPIKEIVLFGEMMAVVAVTMCILFVAVDIGQPLKAWHTLPVIGKMNLPGSMMAWDVLVLNGYLSINLLALMYVLYQYAHNRDYNMKILWPIVLISIPFAISIHTVTAFLYASVKARPMWNIAIVAPRFIASAFCSGPALMILVFQLIRKTTDIKIEDRALFKVAEIITYALAVNIFLLLTELFTDFYSNTVHGASMHYLFFGLNGKANLVPWIWSAVAMNTIAFVMLLFPSLRNKFLTLNIACGLLILGVYIEKGLGLVVPGFIPDTLGDIYEYSPAATEIVISIGVWALGALMFIFMFKFAYPWFKKHQQTDH